MQSVQHLLGYPLYASPLHPVLSALHFQVQMQRGDVHIHKDVTITDWSSIGKNHRSTNTILNLRSPKAPTQL